MKIRPRTLVILLFPVVLIAAGSFRASYVQHQNEKARACIDSMPRLISSNSAVSDFHMDLHEAIINGGGSIEFRVTLASSRDEGKLIRLLGSREPPYEVGGRVSFAGDTNYHWTSLNWEHSTIT